MKTSAQPADQAGIGHLRTVKKRMITCGRPAVPIISESREERHQEGARKAGRVGV